MTALPFIIYLFEDYISVVFAYTAEDALTQYRVSPYKKDCGIRSIRPPVTDQEHAWVSEARGNAGYSPDPWTLQRGSA